MRADANREDGRDAAQPESSRRSSRWSTWHEKFVVEERYIPREARARLYGLAVILVAVGLVSFVVLLIGVATGTGFAQLDVPVEQWFDARRSEDLTGFMIVLAIVFGPFGMPVVVLIVVVIWTITARHVWRPLLLAGGMVTGVVLAQLLAPLVQHPRPPVALMLFGPDGSYSFPSGHVLGAADFFLILAFLLASRIQRPWFTATALILAILGIALQVVSRLYLGYHWISDTTASLALSLIIVGAVIAVDTRRTARVSGETIEGAFSQRQIDGT